MKCKKCGAKILFVRTEKGGMMPCNPRLVAYKEGKSRRVVTLEGKTVACELADDFERSDGTGFIPHWATCPNFKDFKKGR